MWNGQTVFIKRIGFSCAVKDSSMRTLLVSSLLALSAIAPTSAVAMTYEEAAATGVSPVTGSEMLQCAFYWSTWAESLNPNHYGEGKGIWDKGWLATLNPAIQLPAAATTADYWHARAIAEFEAYDDIATYDQLMLDAYDYDVEALNERKFMQWLGECARPV
jgi:hypothetical protein